MGHRAMVRAPNKNAFLRPVGPKTTLLLLSQMPKNSVSYSMLSPSLHSMQPQILFLQGLGASRERLDVELLMAEDDAVFGLPPPPYPLPSELHAAGLRGDGGQQPLFRPRRIETLCSAHQATVDRLENSLEALQAGWDRFRDFIDTAFRQLGLLSTRGAKQGTLCLPK